MSTVVRRDEDDEAAIEDREARLDEALEMTFPASDPVALSRGDVPAVRKAATTEATGREPRC